MTIRIISVLIVIQVVLIQQAFGLNCHDCNTLSTSECLDKYVSDHSTECGDTDNKCIKYKTVSVMADKGSMWGGKSYASAVTRGCLESDEDDNCVIQRIPGGYTYTCVCSGDNCNAALREVLNKSLVVISLVLGFFLTSFFSH